MSRAHPELRTGTRALDPQALLVARIARVRLRPVGPQTRWRQRRERRSLEVLGSVGAFGRRICHYLKVCLELLSPRGCPHPANSFHIPLPAFVVRGKLFVQSGFDARFAVPEASTINNGVGQHRDQQKRANVTLTTPIHSPPVSLENGGEPFATYWILVGKPIPLRTRLLWSFAQGSPSLRAQG